MSGSEENVSIFWGRIFILTFVLAFFGAVFLGTETDPVETQKRYAKDFIRNLVGTETEQTPNSRNRFTVFQSDLQYGAVKLINSDEVTLECRFKNPESSVLTALRDRKYIFRLEFTDDLQVDSNCVRTKTGYFPDPNGTFQYIVFVPIE